MFKTKMTEMTGMSVAYRFWCRVRWYANWVIRRPLAFVLVKAALRLNYRVAMWETVKEMCHASDTACSEEYEVCPKHDDPARAFHWKWW